MKNISDKKTALITGASRGIGKAIADTLAQNGYNLFLVCRNNIDILEANARAYKENHNVQCFAGDVSDSSFVSNVFSHIDSLSVLVNNAGISKFGLLQDMSDDEWHEITGCNLDSVFYCCREASKLMVKEHSGRIINISSVWGEAGASYEAAYSATKGGVNTLTKALAKELAPSGISVNAIACGMIDTDMNAHLSSEEKEAIIDDIPFCKMGTPEDVASLVNSLLSGPDYLTGQIIRLDGAWI